MTSTTTPACLTIGSYAKSRNVPVWKARRVFERGLLPEPGRIGRYRVLGGGDVAALDDAMRLAGYLPQGPGAEGPAVPAVRNWFFSRTWDSGF